MAKGDTFPSEMKEGKADQSGRPYVQLTDNGFHNRHMYLYVPTFADDTGLHPTRIGELPAQCAAACMTNVNVQLLAAEAALKARTGAMIRYVVHR